MSIAFLHELTANVGVFCDHFNQRINTSKCDFLDKELSPEPNVEEMIMPLTRSMQMFCVFG